MKYPQMYNSTVYTNLKKLISFFLNIDNPKKNFFFKKNPEIIFFNFLFFKKFFSEFYFLFFYPKNTDYEFLKKISFYSDKNKNSIFYDYKYFSDYEFYFGVKSKSYADNYLFDYLDENIFPFGRKENFVKINFSELISEIIPINNFYNLGKNFSSELSFILFFVNVINFGKDFSKKINPIFLIYLNNKIKYSEYPIFEKINYNEFKNFVEKIFNDTVPFEIKKMINFEFSENDYFYILEFMRKILFLNFLKNINSLEYEKFNFEKKNYLPDNFSEIKNKIREYLKTGFWNFHKLSFFYFSGIMNEILKIKNSLISDINSKYLEIKNLEIFVQVRGNKIEKNIFSMFLKNSFIYYLFYKFFGEFIKKSIYVGGVDSYSNENINNRIIILYRFWEEFINNLDNSFSENGGADYVKNEVEKLYGIYSDYFDAIYNDIFGGGSGKISTYPVVNHSNLIYHTDINFMGSYYPYLVRQSLFL